MKRAFVVVPIMLMALAGSIAVAGPGQTGTVTMSGGQRDLFPPPIRVRDVDKALFLAIEKADLAGIKSAVASGANVNAFDEDGGTPLLRALSKNVDVVNTVLDLGADPNKLSQNEGWSPIHYAVSKGKTDIVLTLLQRGANPNLRSRPPILWRKDNGESIAGYPQYEPGFQPFGRTPIWSLVRGWRESPAVIDALLKAGADLKTKDSNGWTLLHEAANYGNAVAIDDLVKRGLDVNAKSNQGFTPLHIATRAVYSWYALKGINALLANGAAASIKNKFGQDVEQLIRDDVKSILWDQRLTGKSIGTGSTNLSNINLKRSFLDAILPFAEPIKLGEDIPVGVWKRYKPLVMPGTNMGDKEPSFTFQIKVKQNADSTSLSLTLERPKTKFESITLKNLALNGYEPNTVDDIVVIPGKEVLLDFPVEAAQYGGAVAFDVDASFKNGAWSMRNTESPYDRAVAMNLETDGSDMVVKALGSKNDRPMEIRIDKLVINGVEQTDMAGKIIEIAPDPGYSTVESISAPRGTVLHRILGGGKENVTCEVRFACRSKGNRRWWSQNAVMSR